MLIHTNPRVRISPLGVRLLRAVGLILARPAAVALVVAAQASRLAAQQADVVRGQVTSPDARPIENVTVTATSVGSSVSRSVRTDRGGRFTIVFPAGQGDYFVSFMSLGYAPRRIQVRRTADQEILIADVRMQRVTLLDTVTAAATRRRPERSLPVDDLTVDASTDPAIVSPEFAGDLNALAGSIPGITAILDYNGDATGFSALGLAADQSSVSLNGSPFGGQSLPRDAEMQLSLTTSPFDVSRGGFSGAHLMLHSLPPSQFVRRGMSMVSTAPQLQWTDRSARALGQQYTNVSVGGALSGPFDSERKFYGLSYQLGRRATGLRSLLNTDATGLRAGGIAADSVARLLALASAQGIPESLGTRLPSARKTDEASLLATLDLLPPTSSSGQSLSLIGSGSWKRQDPTANLVGELPTRGGIRTSWNAGVQARHTAFLRSILLSETTVGANSSRSSGSPYASLPSGAVLVSSTFADSSASVQTVWFGGNAALGSSNSQHDVTLMNQISWFSMNNKHRLKLTGELRYDGFESEQTSDARGTFSYNSLADLAANRPAVFTRSLRSRARAANQIVGALSFGDAFRRSRDLQIQYGVRLDANRFMSAPTFNQDVERDIGVRNDMTPSGVYLSPRVGFAYAYGTAPQIAGFAGAVPGPRAVLRGGIGVFQNVPRATLIAGALDNTGLSDATEQVTCVGDAVPTPAWRLYLSGANQIPTACLDGSRGSPFASSLPMVTLFAKQYAPPRSFRSNLSWSGPIAGNRFRAGLDLTYSLNRNQPSAVNVNFSPTGRFTLPAEGHRPVYASPGSIVPATGALAAVDARVSQRFAHVLEQRSDLASRSSQISVALAPTSMRTALSWWLNYVYSDVREQYRGFTSTIGNPLETDWSLAAGPRHKIHYGLGFPVGPMRLSWSGDFGSGYRYTPQVAGDVNGDGYAFNDRTFVVDPSNATDAAVTGAMRALLSDASPTVRQCLSRQLGQLAARHSCEGPWSSTAQLSLSLDPVKLRLPPRARLSVSVSNPVGAADLLLHSESRLRGWGQSPFPEPTLLYVRGFDPDSRRFRYEVNPRFGSTNPQFNRLRSPVTLTLHMRLDVGPTRERQQLVKQLDIGRSQPGDKVPALVLQLIFGRGVVPNPMVQMLRESDSLSLSGAQADSLATWNRRYVIQLDSIWAPVAQYWEELPSRYNSGEAHARYKSARRASIDLLIELAPLVNAVLTAEQRRKLPPLLSRLLDHRYLESIRNGTPAGGAAGSLAGGSVPMGDA